MTYQLKPKMLFCDWHMPGFLPEVTIDYEEYFDQIRRTGAQSLIFQVKTAHGAAFAPTEVGFTNKAMQGDLFGEVCHRAKAAGLEFIAYYNMVLSWELHERHPEWEQVGQDGTPLRMFLYPTQCMSNEAFGEHVRAHMAEVTERYPIDGWFLDLQYFSPEGCFCAACQEKFRARFGYELKPEDFMIENWLDFYSYQVDRREQFIRAAMDQCNSVRPGLSWSWNGCGNPVSISETLHLGADYLSTEAHPPEYLHADHATRYCEALGKPFTLFMPESQGSWGDWTVTTPETIKGLSAIALAHGGSLNINHVPYPCGDYAGKVPQPIWDTITETFRFVAEREKYSRGKHPVPVVAVLHSPRNARLLTAMARTKQWQHLQYETFSTEHALAQLLMETHTPWEIRIEDMPLEDMKRYELLILPYVPHVSDELAAKLREYVRGGGKLIASYHTSLFNAAGQQQDNFALADLFGVDYESTSPYSVSYLDGLDPLFAPEVPAMPLLLKDAASGALNPRNHVLYTRAREGGRVLAWTMDPVVESDFEGGRFVYHDHAPPAYRTAFPGIMLNRFEAGQVIYLPSPFFKAYATKRSPFLREVFRKLVQQVLGVSQRVHLTGPVSIKHALLEDEDGWLLHLIHAQKQTDSMYLDSFYRPDPITVRVRPGWVVQEAKELLSQEAYEVRQDGEWNEFTVPGIRDHLIIRIKRG